MAVSSSTETSDAEPSTPAPAGVTVYIDGACSLCRREIAHYQRVDRSAAVCFVDISAPDAPTSLGVDRRLALARFHVLAGDGRVVSGAAGFVALWSLLPGWRWSARLSGVPGVLWLLELVYRLFLAAAAQARALATARRGQDADAVRGRIVMALDACVSLVCGAHGSTGSTLVSALRDGGHYEPVLALGRRTSPAVGLLDEASIERAFA